MSSLATTAALGNYEETGTQKSKKKDLMVITEMQSFKILKFLAYRHRVGLLMLSNALLIGYILYDKLGWIVGL